MTAGVLCGLGGGVLCDSTRGVWWGGEVHGAASFAFCQEAEFGEAEEVASGGVIGGAVTVLMGLDGVDGAGMARCMGDECDLAVVQGMEVSQEGVAFMVG